MLYSFIFFHCNLAFSSIEKEQRATVIDQCYTPMLDLAEHYGIPIGVEATGWTLQTIKELRPQWIKRFKSLLSSGKCDFIGSGYAQIIGPLVAASVNASNQRIGQAVYKEILGISPTIALINEQAYASGLLPHYTNNNYKTVIMEWDNPKEAHPEWDCKLRYAPQRLRTNQGCEVDLIWNQSVLFHQMQRLAHDEIEYEDYKQGLALHIADEDRVLCLYGSDAEVFNFRPGRFETEAPLLRNEWSRIGESLQKLQNECDIKFCLPSQTLNHTISSAGQILSIETPANPVLVKKQPKYNLLRWAASGRSDLDINTRCYAIAEYLEKIDAPDQDWKELCYLWASDFRTHITAKRWHAYQERLSCFEKRLNITCSALPILEPPAKAKNHSYSTERFVALKTDKCHLKLNIRKGLAFDRVVFPSVSDKILFGTLPYGSFGSISLAADYFSGHVVMEIPRESKKTDLASVDAQVFESEHKITAYSQIPNFFCPMEKSVEVSKESSEIAISYQFHWAEIPPCSLRLLNLTLHPDAFEQRSLFYSTHNGGEELERHLLTEHVNHGRPVSFMVSASCALGMTKGIVYIGDKEKQLCIQVNKSDAALVGMITHQNIDGKFFTRLALSYREFDDTAKLVNLDRLHTFKVKIHAERLI